MTVPNTVGTYCNAALQWPTKPLGENNYCLSGSTSGASDQGIDIMAKTAH